MTDFVLPENILYYTEFIFVYNFWFWKNQIINEFLVFRSI